MKAVSLECGGKTPNIVFADTPNLDAAAQGAASGIFFNSGQVLRRRLAASRRRVDSRCLRREGEGDGEHLPSPVIRLIPRQ